MSVPVTLIMTCDRCGAKATFRVTDGGGNGYRCTCSCHGGSR